MSVPYEIYITMFVASAFVMLALLYIRMLRREAKKIIRMQEELVLNGNYKALEMTTDDIQLLVNKTHVSRLVLITSFTILFLLIWIGQNHFNMSDDVKLILTFFKWW